MKLKSILVVDDEPLIHEVLVDALKEHADSVVSSYALDDAMAKVNEVSFDCIILDINLKGQNGGKIFMHLQSGVESPNKNTPIILSSGYIGEDFIERHKSRFYEILSKPFLAEELTVIIERLASEQLSAPEVSKAPEEIENSEDLSVDSSLPFKIEELAPKVKATLAKVKKNQKLKSLFQQALSNVNKKGLYHTHIGVTINIAAALLKTLGWDSDQTLEKVIFAAYLHDIAIKDRPDLQEFQSGLDFDIKADKFSPEDVELARSHPQRAFDMLQSMADIPPDVPEMILQHHERADGGGFPAKLQHQRITPLATLFIIAHEMAHEVSKAKTFDLKRYISVVTKKHKGPQFRKVTRALSSLE